MPSKAEMQRCCLYGRDLVASFAAGTGRDGVDPELQQGRNQIHSLSVQERLSTRPDSGSPWVIGVDECCEGQRREQVLSRLTTLRHLGREIRKTLDFTTPDPRLATTAGFLTGLRLSYK